MTITVLPFEVVWFCWASRKFPHTVVTKISKIRCLKVTIFSLSIYQHSKWRFSTRVFPVDFDFEFSVFANQRKTLVFCVSQNVPADFRIQFVNVWILFYYLYMRHEFRILYFEFQLKSMSKFVMNTANPAIYCNLFRGSLRFSIRFTNLTRSPPGLCSESLTNGLPST